MNFKQSVILFVVVAALSLTIAASNRNSPDKQTNESLLNFVIRSNDMMTRNPSRSADCFNQYIQVIDEIAKTYQRNHNSCIQDSIDGRSQAEAATLENRNKLASSAASSCNQLNQCSEIESAEQVFECYVTGGSQNARAMYVISSDSSEYLSDLQEQFRLVENREYKCTNETKRQYEKDSVQAYDKFNKCNLGIIDEVDPTEAPVETEPTEEPEVPESTEAPENPEVTEAPIEPEVPESTAAPENPEVTEAPIEPEVPENTESPENPEVTEAPIETEPTEEPENPESDENKPDAKLPEEDLSLRWRLKSRFSKRRF